MWSTVKFLDIWDHKVSCKYTNKQQRLRKNCFCHSDSYLNKYQQQSHFFINQSRKNVLLFHYLISCLFKFDWKFIFLFLIVVSVSWLISVRVSDPLQPDYDSETETDIHTSTRLDLYAPPRFSVWTRMFSVNRDSLCKNRSCCRETAVCVSYTDLEKVRMMQWGGVGAL